MKKKRNEVKRLFFILLILLVSYFFIEFCFFVIEFKSNSQSGLGIMKGAYIENTDYDGKNVIKFYPVNCSEICLLKFYLNGTWERVCAPGGIISQDFMIENKIKDIYVNLPNNCWWEGIPEEWKK